MIIEICPKCGHPLLNIEIATLPPIPAKKCYNCGWYWEGERETIEFIPFKIEMEVKDE